MDQVGESFRGLGRDPPAPSCWLLESSVFRTRVRSAGPVGVRSRPEVWGDLFVRILIAGEVGERKKQIVVNEFNHHSKNTQKWLWKQIQKRRGLKKPEERQRNGTTFSFPLDPSLARRVQVSRRRAWSRDVRMWRWTAGTRSSWTGPPSRTRRRS